MRFTRLWRECSNDTPRIVQTICGALSPSQFFPIGTLDGSEGKLLEKRASAMARRRG